MDPDLLSDESLSESSGVKSRRALFSDLYVGNRTRLLVYSFGSAVEGILEASALAIIGLVAVALADSDTDSIRFWWLESVSVQIGLSVFCGLILTRLLVGLGNAFIATRLASRISLDKRAALLRGYSESNFETTMKISAADLQQMLATWPHKAGSQAASLVSQAASILVVLSMFAIAFFSNAILALSSIVFVGLFFALFQPLRNYIRRLSGRVLLSEQNTADSVDELSNLQSESVLFGVDRELLRSTACVLEKEIESRQRAALVKASVSPVYTALALGSVGGFLLLVANSSLDLTNLAPTLLIVIRALGYGQRIQQLGSSIAALGPLLQMLDRLEKNFESNRRKHGDVVLDSFERFELVDVCGAYDGTPVLDGISLSFSRGVIVGLVGPSGGGKTTLLRLIAGQISPSSGSIKVNGVELEEIQQDSFAQMVASVPQFPRLISGALGENVTFMRGFISGQEIETALRLAALEMSSVGAKDPNSALRVGQPTISGGQAQRIGLARALVGRPSLLLLDEPTSAVDGPAQERIIETIESLRGDAAVIIVTHRPEILRCCSVIHVIEGGQMTASGTWGEVLKINAYFQEMVGDG